MNTEYFNQQPAYLAGVTDAHYVVDRLLKGRAHNLRDAMLVAALTPLGEWGWPGLDDTDEKEES